MNGRCRGGGAIWEVLRANEGRSRSLRLPRTRANVRACGPERSWKVDVVALSPGLLKPDRGSVACTASRRPGSRPRRLARACGLSVPTLDGNPVSQRRREHLPQPQRQSLLRAGGARRAANSILGGGVSTSTSTSCRRALGRAEANRRDRARARDRRALPDSDEQNASLESHAIERLLGPRPPREGERVSRSLNLSSSRGGLRDMR